MSYKYEQHRGDLFTEEGLALTLKMKARIDYLLKEAGAFTADAAYRGCAGSNWTMLAVLDYFVEKGVITRVSPKGTWAQYEVYANSENLPRSQWQYVPGTSVHELAKQDGGVT